MLNPFMLFGLSAVAVPILIHLILRQRPKPRPWGAMRWLRAAILAAQRRYRLTNLLLLLLRCLALAVLALALARPYFRGLGGGNHLVLVVDLTASMGAVAEGDGALEGFRAGFDRLGERERPVALVTLSDRVAANETADWSSQRKAIDNLVASHFPGGLDSSVSDDQRRGVLDYCRDTSDVVLVSDFRQDRGDKLVALLEPKVRSVRRWRVGKDGPNAFITGLHALDDLLPGHACDLILEMQGACDRGELAVDQGIPQPIRFVHQGTGEHGRIRARVTLPGLSAGRHVLRFTLNDDGLLYDNRFELPVQVRDRIRCLAVEDENTYTGTALAAARRFFECERVRPALLSSRPLPQGGLVLLRREIGAVAAGAVADWVRAGGVLWANYGLLEARPGLRDLLPAVRRVGEAVGGGPLRTGTPALDESLSQRAHLDPVQSFAFGPDAEVLLRAGDKPLVAAVPADRGWVLVEAATIERLDSFTNTGAFVEWVRLCARAYTQRVRRPRFVEAGSISRRERRLSREGTELTVATGAPILAENGLWTETDAAGRERDLVVIPNRQEGVLRYGGDGDLVTDAEEAIPDEGAAAWSWWLFLLLLAILAGEGALAAWAGRTYGT